MSLKGGIMDKSLSTKRLSGSTLKIIAMISMLIDHTAAFLLRPYINDDIYGLLREIGRIAFPIFCFLIVEGYFHTRSVKKYLIRLLLFGLASEIPFDLASRGLPGTAFGHQNVFFTLFLGLLVVWIIDRHKNKLIVQVPAIIAGCFLAHVFNVDYDMFGIIQILVFYDYRYMKYYRISGIIMLNILMGQPAGALALLFTENYNGKKGINIKYFVYLFYMLHLMALYIIRRFI